MERFFARKNPGYSTIISAHSAPIHPKASAPRPVLSQASQGANAGATDRKPVTMKKHTKTTPRLSHEVRIRDTPRQARVGLPSSSSSTAPPSTIEPSASSAKKIGRSRTLNSTNSPQPVPLRNSHIDNSQPHSCWHFSSALNPCAMFFSRLPLNFFCCQKKKIVGSPPPPAP